MSVYNQRGEAVDVFSLWRDRRTVVAFTRHMGCRFCKEQALLLEKCRSDYLSAADITSIIVTIGKHTDIPRFREETQFGGEIYVDTVLTEPKCFQLLKFENGKHMLFQDIDKAIVLDAVQEASKRSTACLLDGGYGGEEGPYTGDVFQVGGVFVLGPGNACDFMFRSAFVGDIPDMQEVCAAATGVVPKTAEDAMYPQALEWNQKLKLDSKIEPGVTGSPLPTSESINTQQRSEADYSLRWIFSLAAAAGLAAALCHCLPIPVCVAVGAVVTVTVHLHLLPEQYSHLNAQTITSPQNREVELITLRQLDEQVMLRGGQKCECGFIKSIDMTVLKSPLPIQSEAERQALKVPAEHHQPLESIQCYVREFLAKPNPLLGRKGPTCPFVPASLKMDSIYLGLVQRDQVTGVESMERIVIDMLEKFKGIEPSSGPKAQYKAIVLIFPFISLDEAPIMIDGLQKAMKPKFVAEGLMVGEFHKLNNACGLHNDNFFPLRTPHPCLAIRNMVPSDIVFLNGSEFSAETRKNMISRYLEKFGELSRNDEQSEVARQLLKDL